MKRIMCFGSFSFLAAAVLLGTLLVAPLNTLAAGWAGRLATDDGQIKEAPPNPPPDERFKADILVIVAHPDDETEVTGYLARAIFDEHKRVAAIFGTPGNGGGDAMGNAQAAALGAIRATEAREAMATFGVLHVWFLGGTDTPGQNVLQSLETWDHGRALGETVRLIRLTRPEVIMTWLPVYVAGENHDDHQAAGVIATEAFDLAGDATAFPEQISAPRNRNGIMNLTEGLLPWQPKKLYYFSDALHTEFLEGQGPSYNTTDVSPSQHKTYYQLAVEEAAHHLTQGDTGQAAQQALNGGPEFIYAKEPVRLVLGKSLVGGTTTGDVLEGITPGQLPFAPVQGYRPEARQGLSVELGGPWAFYRRLWQAHNMEHLRDLIKVPEVAVGNGEAVNVPILIHNDTDQPVEVTLTSTLSTGWKEINGTARYPVRPHETYPAETRYIAPATDKAEWQTLTWKAEANGQTIGTLTLRVMTDSPGLPQ
ncbi:MAG: PIG-L family deacetylase [Terriglobia bacterium]